MEEGGREGVTGPDRVGNLNTDSRRFAKLVSHQQGAPIGATRDDNRLPTEAVSGSTAEVLNRIDWEIEPTGQCIRFRFTQFQNGGIGAKRLDKSGRVAVGPKVHVIEPAGLRSATDELLR